MRKLTWHAALLLTMTTLLASCADSAGEPATDSMKSSESSTSTSTSTEADERADRPGVATAMADLAERSETDPGDVTITSLEQVTWRDGSLGCPQPGMAYSQALVDGQRLVLAVASDPTQSFDYHAGPRGAFSYCESPQPPVEGAPGST